MSQYSFFVIAVGLIYANKKAGTAADANVHLPLLDSMAAALVAMFLQETANNLKQQSALLTANQNDSSSLGMTFLNTLTINILFLLSLPPLAVSIYLLTLAIRKGEANKPRITHSANKPLITRSADFEDCRLTIGTKKVPSLGLTNELNPYESRALPNQRLVTAFGIANCFTTSKKSECQDFRASAEKVLQIDQRAWRRIADGVQRDVQYQLRNAGQETRLCTLVQTVSMKASIGALLGFDTTRHDVDVEIRQLAEEINTQWLHSKSSDDSKDEEDGCPSWAFEKQTELQHALEAVFPNWRENKDNNKVNDNDKGNDSDKDKDSSTTNTAATSKNSPLNFILPGYETLWRVVLLLFLELTARNHPTAEAWRANIGLFPLRPCLEQLTDDTATQDEGVTALSIVKEALRLYPPTRRIHREFHTRDGGKHRVAADIEACHRDPEFWGENALHFNPSRFKPDDTASDKQQFDFERARLLSFGAKPFACPARRMTQVEGKEGREDAMPFGVAMIAVIVGTLTREVDSEWEVVGEFPGRETPLETDREAYGEVKLRRRR